jgi:hypothetical protein
MDSSWWDTKEFGSLLITACTIAVNKLFEPRKNHSDQTPYFPWAQGGALLKAERTGKVQAAVLVLSHPDGGSPLTCGLTTAKTAGKSSPCSVAAVRAPVCHLTPSKTHSLLQRGAWHSEVDLPSQWVMTMSDNPAAWFFLSPNKWEMGLSSK